MKSFVFFSKLLSLFFPFFQCKINKMRRTRTALGFRITSHIDPGPHCSLAPSGGDYPLPLDGSHSGSVADCASGKHQWFQEIPGSNMPVFWVHFGNNELGDYWASRIQTPPPLWVSSYFSAWLPPHSTCPLYHFPMSEDKNFILLPLFVLPVGLDGRWEQIFHFIISEFMKFGVYFCKFLLYFFILLSPFIIK